MPDALPLVPNHLIGDTSGKAVQKSRIIMPKDKPMIIIICQVLNLQDLAIPVAISHHFQGSVIQIKKGIHAASSVKPDENA